MNGANNNGVAQACKVRKRLDVSFAARLFNLLLFMAFIAALLHCCAVVHDLPLIFIPMLYAGASFGGSQSLGGNQLATPISFFLIFPSIS
ncbi:hypothetical protein [Serratia quinivorans]|uniref:hypothetical protein n=1 Tax=Serratia quinivorans TaxID=137545 RepID=UPI0021BD7774|nr:hypothetical protein [Serratia quinivorans]